MVDESFQWLPSRDAALTRLREFSPLAGYSYASHRNYDYGSDNFKTLSMLSPWLRHRCIGEWEVVRQVLKLHTVSAAEKYVQEVCWRSYWKGWLEMRPLVWEQYLADVQSYYLQSEVSERAEEAIKSHTGIECFDHWCNELMETGYLHNHARMWFASIWIFTLKLPWQLGADFFMRHLLDGDPASNTLSWRWIAGLHTKGKTYLARPDNIEKFTGNRFNPAGQLASNAETLLEASDYCRQALPVSNEFVPAGRNGLLLTDDDLHPEPLPGCDEYESVASVTALGLSTPGTIDPMVMDFNQMLLDTTLTAMSPRVDYSYRCHSEVEVNDVIEHLVQWAVNKRLERVVCAYVPVGPNAIFISQLGRALDSQGISICKVRREWDARLWPHSGKGFFSLKKKLPQLLQPILDDVSGQGTLF